MLSSSHFSLLSVVPPHFPFIFPLLPSFLQPLFISFHLLHSCYCISLPPLFLFFSPPTLFPLIFLILDLCLSPSFAPSLPLTQLVNCLIPFITPSLFHFRHPLTSQHLSNPFIASFSIRLIFPDLHCLTRFLPLLLTILQPCATITLHQCFTPPTSANVYSKCLNSASAIFHDR